MSLAERLNVAVGDEDARVEAASVIVDSLDVWASAVRSGPTAGRGDSSKREIYGIKKLRELILGLAVRGLLVPQNPNDEPASELLKRIASEKAMLVNEGKIKRGKQLPPIRDERIPFKLPDGWNWSLLGELSSDVHYGYTASAKNNHTGTRLLRITDIQNDRVNWSTVPGCEIEADKAKSYTLENNDILIARTGGTIGKSYLVENISVEAVFASYLIRVRRISGVYAQYIKKYLGSTVYWDQLYGSASGTGQPNVNATSLKQLLVPIPPLEEQHRIVAKVDELMTLCDQLEQQTEASLTAHETLVETILQALIRPTATGDGSAEDAVALFFEHFDTLFTTEHSIDQLKQAILQLAVQGKLVPQDSNDEPVSELLVRLASEKARLVAEGKVKKRKAAYPIGEKEKPFDLPTGWVWVSLRDVCILENGDRSKNYPNKSLLVESGVPFVNAGHLLNGRINITGLTFITEERFDLLKAGKIKDGDILFCLRGSLGKSAIVEGLGKGAIASSLVIVRLYSQLDRHYFHNYFNSPLSYRNIKRYDNGTAQPNLSAADLGKFLVPLPPLEEQRRIVAKVDELMDICDQLKARINEAKQTEVLIADAVAEQATH